MVINEAANIGWGIVDKLNAVLRNWPCQSQYLASWEHFSDAFSTAL